MKELYSNKEDCFKLARKLKQKLGEKIEFYESIYQEVISGKYYSFSLDKYTAFKDFRNDAVTFYFKFCNNGFLRIGVGNYLGNDSLGHKLAVLSDLYEVLKEEYGKPTVFYTTKNDDENMLNFHWAFCNKEEVIQNFKNGTVFDDAEIDELIIIDSKHSNYNGTLNEITRNSFEENVGLPFNMMYIVDEDIENYIKYKKGKKITYSDGEKIDFVKVTSIDKKYKRQRIK